LIPDARCRIELNDNNKMTMNDRERLSATGKMYRWKMKVEGESFRLNICLKAPLSIYKIVGG